MVIPQEISGFTFRWLGLAGPQLIEQVNLQASATLHELGKILFELVDIRRQKPLLPLNAHEGNCKESPVAH